MTRPRRHISKVAQALYMLGLILPPTAVTIRIIRNARLEAGAVSAGQGGGVDQAYDGWRVVSQFEFQQMGGKRIFDQVA